jgi:hypothetical protein
VFVLCRDTSMGDVTKIGFFSVCAASPKETKPSAKLVKYFCKKPGNSVCACCGILCHSIDDEIQKICFCICAASPKETKVCEVFLQNGY